MVIAARVEYSFRSGSGPLVGDPDEREQKLGGDKLILCEVPYEDVD